MLEDVFGQLKEFISNYSFKNEDEEILFFKKIKPNIFSNLLYCRKVCDIVRRPKGTTEEMTRYINYELDQIQQYNFNHLDFYTYLLHDETNLDKEYFL